MPPSFPPDQRARRCPPSPVPVTSAQAAHDKPHRPPPPPPNPRFLADPPHNDKKNANAAGGGQQRKHPQLPKRRDQRVWTGRRNHRRTQRARPPRPPPSRSRGALRFALLAVRLR